MPGVPKPPPVHPPFLQDICCWLTVPLGLVLMSYPCSKQAAPCQWDGSHNLCMTLASPQVLAPLSLAGVPTPDPVSD